MTWPVADLDPVRRLRVLAAAVPGAMLAEQIIDAPIEQVWAVAADLEGELPRYLPDVRALRITRREPALDTASGEWEERLEAYARGYVGLRARFDIVLRPGWCVMRSRFLLGGIAAVAFGADRTRFAFLGGVHIPAQREVAPALAILGRRAAPRVLNRFVVRVRLQQAGPGA